MRALKRPSWRQTYTYMKRLAEHYSFGCIAGWCGTTVQTAEAWGRPKESDETPTGTGKSGPLDTSIRIIGKAHAKDPGLAREIAESHVEYVDHLDALQGKGFVQEGGSLLHLIGTALREHADVLNEVINEGDSRKIWEEYSQFECVNNQFKAALKEQLKCEVKETAVQNTVERFSPNKEAA